MANTLYLPYYWRIWRIFIQSRLDYWLAENVRTLCLTSTILRIRHTLPFSNIWYFLTILIIQAIIVAIFHRPPSFIYANPDIAKYGYFMPFISGAIGIALWLRIAKILEPAIGKSKIVNLIADNSFSIMVNHFLGFFIINSFYGLLLTKIFHAGRFDIATFKSNIWYLYCPSGLPQFQIFHLIAGISIPIFIQLFLNNITRIFKQRFKISI